MLKLKITGLDQSPDFTDDEIGLEVGLKVMLISLAQRPMGTTILPPVFPGLSRRKNSKRVFSSAVRGHGRKSTARLSREGAICHIRNHYPQEQCPYLDFRKKG